MIENQTNKQRKNRFERFMKNPWGKFAISLYSALFTIGLTAVILLYGPWDSLRVFIITTSENTINHRYISRVFYTEETIAKVLSNNKVVELETVTDTGSITVSKKDEVILRDISADNYDAWMLEITNPERVILGVSKYFGVKGQKIPYLLENYPGAIGGINAGGFGDANGFGNGGVAMGLVISEGEILHMPSKSSYNIIGFNEDDILILGKYSRAELEGLNLRDAVEFNPFLIINGEPAEVKGNGGWGHAPRTAIGQRADGTVVFVVIDGRSTSSAGATMKTVQDIMIEQKCINAANLDGGSSTVLAYKGEVINNPSGSDRDGMRFLPNAFIVKGD